MQTDHDPRNPAYIATQGPLPHTAADLWQMVWEQGCVVMVMLTRLIENDVTMCHRYWPEEGSELYHIYEVLQSHSSASLPYDTATNLSLLDIMLTFRLWSLFKGIQFEIPKPTRQNHPIRIVHVSMSGRKIWVDCMSE